MDTDKCASGSCTAPLQTREEKRKAFDHADMTAAEICDGLRNDLHRIGMDYLSDHDLSRVETDVHDVWDELIHAAKIIPSVDAEHDRLVTLILELRELGNIMRRNKDAGAEEAAVLSNGQRPWADLPFLAEELNAFWTNESRTLTVSERQSLAVMSGCPLAFQGGAGNGQATGPSSAEDQVSQQPDLTAADLLPACLEWLKYGKCKLAKLSLDNHRPALSKEDAALASPGPLAVAAGIKDEGFSLARWLFWRQRLGELYRGGGEQVAKPARACFEQMVNAGMSMSVNIPGERRFLDKAFEALDKELAAREFKGSVGIEEIEIDPRWAIGDGPN
ncbi:hypothetical protein ACCO45_007321 [Purpureocillium lilacinum]|uniref:Uncharacterized protein n=1 Tax=Purpureocillium lilacinum TaxID=33203 RepID=A0ACC4DUB9_PURLI